MSSRAPTRSPWSAAWTVSSLAVALVLIVSKTRRAPFARYALVDHPVVAKARDLIVHAYSQRRMERWFTGLIAATT